MHMFLIKYGICRFQGVILRCFLVILGSSGLHLEPLAAPGGSICSNTAYMQYLHGFSGVGWAGQELGKTVWGR